ncbi:hypothetical protein ACOSB0_00280, partial [Candidatus Phytoplasma citri]
VLFLYIQKDNYERETKFQSRKMNVILKERERERERERELKVLKWLINKQRTLKPQSFDSQ